MLASSKYVILVHGDNLFGCFGVTFKVEAAWRFLVDDLSELTSTNNQLTTISELVN